MKLRRRIGTRLVLAVIAAMSVVLTGAGAFVYWRVSYALDRQLNQDLTASAPPNSSPPPCTKALHCPAAQAKPCRSTARVASW